MFTSLSKPNFITHVYKIPTAPHLTIKIFTGTVSSNVSILSIKSLHTCLRALHWTEVLLSTFLSTPMRLGIQVHHKNTSANVTVCNAPPVATIITNTHQSPYLHYRICECRSSAGAGAVNMWKVQCKSFFVPHEQGLQWHQMISAQIKHLASFFLLFSFCSAHNSIVLFVICTPSNTKVD